MLPTPMLDCVERALIGRKAVAKMSSQDRGKHFTVLSIPGGMQHGAAFSSEPLKLKACMDTSGLIAVQHPTHFSCTIGRTPEAHFSEGFFVRSSPGSSNQRRNSPSEQGPETSVNLGPTSEQDTSILARCSFSENPVLRSRDGQRNTSTWILYDDLTCFNLQTLEMLLDSCRARPCHMFTFLPPSCWVGHHAISFLQNALPTRPFEPRQLTPQITMPADTEVVRATARPVVLPSILHETLTTVTRHGVLGTSHVATRISQIQHSRQRPDHSDFSVRDAALVVRSLRRPCKVSPFYAALAVISVFLWEPLLCIVALLALFQCLPRLRGLNGQIPVQRSRWSRRDCTAVSLVGPFDFPSLTPVLRIVAVVLLCLSCILPAGAVLDLTDVQSMNQAAFGGATLTAYGTDFTSDIAARVGRTACSTTTWISASAVHCIVSAGIAESLSATISVAQSLVTLEVAVSFDTGMVSSVARGNHASLGGVSSTLSGVNLGTESYSVAASMLTACEETRWVSQTIVVCKTAPGVSRSLRATLTAGSRAGTLSEAITLDAESISALTHGNGGSGGRSMTLSGADLGTLINSVGAEIVDTACEAS